MDNLGMDVTGDSRAALVILAFLQADCQGAELQKELHSLSNEFHLTRDINCNGPRINTAEVGSVETDGYLEPECLLQTDCREIDIVPVDLHDIQPVAELQGQYAAANIQQVAEEIREIAAQLQESVMAQATNNLMRNRSDSQSEVSLLNSLEEAVNHRGSDTNCLTHNNRLFKCDICCFKSCPVINSISNDFETVDVL
ncbi:uncharacterized protein LOC133955531 isoform X2 [Platichthys flesus]|uniref:uncharacterized protein LOC133955531 isoform X2 n=1 Tax=Platichthys flesus TaxID=8260 RepID=UPI002DBEB105|nr:uncharacterized protein LOC133955531 isoform X2 [Platichthys flesus]